MEATRPGVVLAPIVSITDILSANLLPPGLPALDAEQWEEIVITAMALGLAPLLHGRLIQRGMMLPPLAMAKLTVIHRAHTQRNEAIARQLAELLAAFDRRQIDVMVLKGALLAPLAYPEPGLRPMNDIDLLFRPGDLDRVGLVLEDLGYQGKHKPAGRGPGITKHLSTYRRPGGHGNTPNPYLSAGSDRMVEPHGSLEESWFGLKANITPGVWDRAVPITLHGQPAYRLSTPDLLLHLAVHATFHLIMGATLFVQLYDLARVIQTWPDELNPARLLALSRAAKAQPFFYAGLYWATTLYQAPIPPTILTTLAPECPPSLLAFIHTLDAPALFCRTQQPPLITLPQRLQRGLYDRREAARWAISWQQKWQIWQTALAFHKTDTAGWLKLKLWSGKIKKES